MKRGGLHFYHRLSRGISYYIKGIYKKGSEENIFFLSAGIAFNGIICLLPLLLLLTSIVGVFLHSSTLSLQKIDDVLNAAFPSQPYAQQIKSVLKGIIQDIIRYRSTIGLYGIVILLWTSASMFSSVRYVLMRIYQIKRSRFVIITFIENVIIVIIIGALFIIANFFSWVLLPSINFIQEIPGLEKIDLSGLLKMLSHVASYLPALIMFFLLNRFIPGKGISNRVAFVSAFTTTTLWWVAGLGFGWYLTTFQPYSKLYGTYAFMVVFLLWVYFSSVVFTLGAIVGQLFKERFPK
ncbi:MAG: YihY/virulence factor BrkB family protein [Bacteroidota bacterium]|nr:YihY/virulence factor BrkB family protein [Bacteroidota bacterium]